MFDAFCSYCESIYGGSHSMTKNGLNYDVLSIVNGHDHFQICLADKWRFGQFDLYHRNWGAFLGGTYGWHCQGKYYSLSFAIFCAYAHQLGKEIGLKTTIDDYRRFMADWEKTLQKEIIMV